MSGLETRSALTRQHVTYSTSYSSMQISSNAAEAISFIPMLYNTVKSAGLSNVKLTCCDATGWPAQTGYTSALMNANMQQYLGVITSHMYSGDPNSPLATKGLPVWMTEGDAQSMGFVTTWHSSGAVNEGMTWANKIATGIVSANLSAYFFWEGFEEAQTSSASHLIDSSGSNAEPSGMFWAFVMWSRFIRPGADRVAVSGSPSGVVTAAFKNTDGSVIVVLTNSGSSARTVSVSLSGFTPSSAQAWLQDNSHQVAATTATLSGSSVSVQVTSNGVVTIKLAGGGGSSSPPPPPPSSPPPPPPPSASSSTMKVVTTTTSAPSSGCTQALYGQCGGIGWSGCTGCASGSTCSAGNPYYSQCVPA
jgi:O-glycosyl hydrolase